MITQDRQFVGVSQQFLRKDYFRKGFQIMLKRRVILKQLVEYIGQIYDRWIKFANQSISLGNKTLSHCSFKWFKDLIDDKVFKMFLKIMSFQEKELKKVPQQNRQSHLTSDVILSNLSQYTIAQDSYKALIINLRMLVQQEQKQITINQETTDEIISLFSQKQQNKRVDSLEQKLNQINQLRDQSQSQLIALELQRAAFIQEALKFRYMLCSSRGHILQRFKDVCQHTVSGFLMMFMALKQNLKSAKTQKMNRSVYVEDPSKSKAGSESSYRISLQENCGDILAFMDYLRELASLMRTFCRQFNDEIGQIQKILLDNITNSFHISQSSFDNVSNLLDTLKSAFVRMQNICQHISDKYQKLQGLIKDLQKLNEIALSLNKSLMKTPSKEQDRENKMDREKQKLKHKGNYNEMSNMSNINQAINRIFKAIQEESQVFVVWTESKKLNIENMSNTSVESLAGSSISSFGETVEQVKEVWIKPVEELWLWEDWKDQETYRIPSDKITFLKQSLQTMKLHQLDANNEPERVQDCTCLLTNVKGKLEIRAKTLRFNSPDYIGRVAYSDIEKVFIKTIREKDVLYIMSKRGLLRFQDLSKPQEIKSTIKQKVERGSSPKFTSRISKSFKNYQPGYISVQEDKEFTSDSRVNKVESLLPKLQDHTLIVSTVFEDTTLVTFFRQFLSDIEVTINGKSYQNLLSYTYSQRSTSLTSTKWSPQPPTYFTGLMGNPITSKLLYSEKVIQYEKKTPCQIPKLPQILHVKNYLKVFWVSKQRIVLQIKTVYTNSPYINDYLVESVFDIMQSNRNIEIKCYRKVTLLKDSKQQPALTQLIKSGIEESVKEYLKVAAMKLGKPSIEGDMVSEQNREKQCEAQSGKSQSDGKSDPLKTLAIVLSTLLVIWILNKLF